jgi:hypothetical protein
MDDVYDQHIHFHPLTIHIKFTTTHHYLQLYYNPLQITMWRHNNNIFDYVFKLHIGSSSSILDGVRSCHVAQ